ncbi:hypothetical protein GCM10029964_125660 [Kibdelosporangium lantanae]
MSTALRAVPDAPPDTHENIGQAVPDPVTVPVPGLPRLHPAALHGPVGEAVRRIHPTTEAHPAGFSFRSWPFSARWSETAHTSSSAAASTRPESGR